MSANTRSSHRKCSVKRVFLEIMQYWQENTCARVSFLIKSKVNLWESESEDFAKFLRKPFLQNTSDVLTCQAKMINFIIFFHIQRMFSFKLNFIPGWNSSRFIPGGSSRVNRIFSSRMRFHLSYMKTHSKSIIKSF